MSSLLRGGAPDARAVDAHQAEPIARRAVRQQTPLEPTAGTAVVVYHQRRARIPEFDVGQLATVESLYEPRFPDDG